MNRSRHFLAAFTMTELLMAVAIISIISTAVAAMLFGGMNTSRYVIGSRRFSLADRRRLPPHLLQPPHGLLLDAPATTTPTHSFTIHTQPDSSNGNTTYQVSYALSGANPHRNRFALRHQHDSAECLRLHRHPPLHLPPHIPPD